ncbi:MAG: asparagine synthase (glutamine-hydrolyzing) [Thermodesulfobacteriota bacterium]
MCGIAGILSCDGATPSREELITMCRILRHRGPDGEGFYQSPPLNGPAGDPLFRIALGHRRLKIIDLSDAGRQPMANEDGKIWVTYNGEIYNFREIRKTLESAGHRFRSGTDTEVILHAYEEWGEECTARFNGMWAFALWDEEKKRLHLSRDRFGVKPLYVLVKDHEILFASEIKAILAVRSEERVPNIDYAATFVTHGLMDHGEETFFRNIRSIPPGHSMIVTPEGSRTVRYWDPAAQVGTGASPCSASSEDPAEEFLSLLEDSVRMRLSSDAPLGSCLSGGLDSSSIVALASRHFPHIPTFTTVFADPSCDETPYAEAMVRCYETQPHWERPGPQEFMDLLGRMIWHQDEPGSAYGIYPQWKVMEAASGHVRVLLDGQGGDELLGGYTYFLPHYLKTLKEDREVRESHFHEAQAAVKGQYGPAFAATYEPGCNGDLRYRQEVLDPALRARGMVKEKDYRGPFMHHLDNVLFRSLTRDILPALLHYQDRMSMAFSIESRVPFLDCRLVEFCFTLPYHHKIHHGTTKVILRKAMAQLLPPLILGRRDKLGFPAPLSGWVRGGLRRPILDILESARSLERGILHPPTVHNRLHAHIRGETDHTWEIWRWLSLEIWFREFID